MSISNKLTMVFSLFFALPMCGQATTLSLNPQDHISNSSVSTEQSQSTTQENASFQPNKTSLEEIAAIEQKHEEEMGRIKKEKQDGIDRVYRRQKDLEEFTRTGICIGCDLSHQNLSQIIKAHNKNNTPLNLNGSDVSHSLMIKVDLSRGKFEETNFNNATVEECNLDWANLNKSILTGTNLSKSSLEYTKMEGALVNFYTNLAATNIDKVIINSDSLTERFLLAAIHTASKLRG